MSRLKQFYQFLLDAFRNPRTELSRRQHQVRYAWEVITYCGRQLIRHRAEGMAAELTYRTIFALMPLVVLGLVMFRIVGGLEDVQTTVENELYSFFGVPEIPEGDYVGEIDGSETTDTDFSAADPTATRPGPLEIQETPTEGDDSATVAGAQAPKGIEAADTESVNQDANEAESQRQARASIRRTLHQVAEKIAALDFASIGVFGLLLFIYAAVALADSTEYLFNIIYEAPTSRPIHIRVAIHWSIITLGSGLLALSLYLSAQVVDWIGTFGPSGSIIVLGHLLSVTASWVLLFLLYALMPNTHVSLRSAAIGAVVSALLWETAKFGFQVYVAKAVPYAALYGALGLIPLFLFWMYVTWLIVLFGLVLTHTLQTLRGRTPIEDERERERLATGDPDWMVPIMAEVALAFEQGKSIDRQELADELHLTTRVIHEMANKLLEAGCLRRVSTGAGEEDSLTLARPADQISVGYLLELAHQARPTSMHAAWQTLAPLKQAEREAAGDRTLADLIAEVRSAPGISVARLAESRD